MNFDAANPHIRFAEQLNYRSSGNTVLVKDCRIFFILSGSGKIIINNQGYPLVPDSLFYCRQNSIYSLASDGITLLSLNFDLTQKNAEQTENFSPIPVCDDQAPLPDEYERISDCDFINSYIYLKNGKKFLNAINDILMEFKLRRIYFREKSSGILKNLLIDLVRDQTLPACNSNKAVIQTIDYINANFENDITNSQLAKIIGYQEHYLNRLFLKHTGQTIHQYVLTKRLSEAKKLIMTSDLSLSEIAEQSGFNNYSYFSYYFKRVTGITPFHYRETYRSSI